MKKKFKLLLTVCLFLFTLCTMALSVNAGSYYYTGTITVNPSFPNSTFDGNEQINIPFTVTRTRSNNFRHYLSKYYCDVYGPDGTRISTTSNYFSDMNSAVLNWTVFDNKTPRDMGEYTVKYYTSTDDGSSCHFYVNSVSGTYGSNIRWTLNNAGELKISGSGNMPSIKYSTDAPWYSYKQKIQSVVIENGVTSICEQAFRDYQNLTNVTLPKTITRIGERAFYECSMLTDINFPDSLVQIGNWAFYNCSSLQNVALPNNLRLLGESSFYGIGIRTIVIPSGIVQLPSHVFAYCYSLESITIPTSVKGIAGTAFYNCSSLNTVNYKGTQAEWNRVTKPYDLDRTVTVITSQPQTPVSTPTPTPVAPADTQLKSLTNTSNGIKLVWNKVSNAQGYYIYRKAGNGSWQKAATIKKGTTASYTDKKAANGVQYSYMVKAYNGNSEGNGTTLSTVRLNTPTVTSCTSKSKAITLKWKKNTKVSGYQIKYINGSSVKTIKVNQKTAVKYVIKKLKKGKKYTIQMRSYKKVSKQTCYSGWSAAKKIVVR